MDMFFLKYILKFGAYFLQRPVITGFRVTVVAMGVMAMEVDMATAMYKLCT